MGTVPAILGRFAPRTTAAVSASFSTFRRTMVGYDPSFLGKSYAVPLPSFSAEFSPNVLTRADRPDTYFQDGSYTTYIHYSVATNKSLRQPIVVALNIDQDKIKSVRRGSWSVDSQVGFDYQLDNRYYRSNPYDRGHLARRSSAAWGDTEADAREASDATMFYTNASLQHANFNQDEWLGLEDWVKNLTEDSTNKISVFSGPIYNRQDGTSMTIGSPPAIIPSAFFKVVCFVDKSRKLTTRAFFMAQDRRALSDKSAKRRNFDLGVYQVSVRMIEEETGLVFPAVLKETNPMAFTPPTPERPLPSGPGPVRDPIFPEIVPVAPGTRVDEENTRKPGMVQNSNVLILSAMVNAVGNERKNEWVTIGNFGSEEVDLAGWTLSDSKRAPLELSQKLEPGETVRFKPLMMNRNTGVVLYNKGGSITLTDPDGYVHDRVVYSVASDNIRENVPVIFHLDK